MRDKSSERKFDKEADATDKIDVTPTQMDVGDAKIAKESKHIEEVPEKEGADYYSSPEFKVRERHVVRKMDYYIAPLMGSFNFIVRPE